MYLRIQISFFFRIKVMLFHVNFVTTPLTQSIYFKRQCSRLQKHYTYSLYHYFSFEIQQMTAKDICECIGIEKLEILRVIRW